MTERSRLRTALRKAVDKLDEAQVRQLVNIAGAMAAPIQEVINPSSNVVTSAFAAEFRARLQAHHATHTTAMDRLSFENAFLAASRAAGRKTLAAPSRTTRFFDATIDGKNVALKTEGAKSMKPHQLHISKLSEAAWIQDMRSARTRRTRTLELIAEFRAAVQRIFVLRFYQSELDPYYELVEIPVRYFALLSKVGVEAFDSDAPRIKIADAKGDIMEVRLDRSDAKITVSKILKSRCVVHGEWQLTGMS